MAWIGAMSDSAKIAEPKIRFISPTPHFKLRVMKLKPENGVQPHPVR